jgi:hypothetical protein
MVNTSSARCRAQQKGETIISKTITAIAALSISALAFLEPATAAEMTTDAQALSDSQCAEQTAQQSAQQAGQQQYFQADSFSFGVEREMKESGEKGGTEDINIGVGELQECTISKSAARTKSVSR